MPAKKPPTWHALNQRIIQCDRCPRLRGHCAEIATTKRKAYSDWDYWGQPVPNFGDPTARLLIVGLAPGAHGANRTGRMFTGDRSGDWLYRAMHRTGFANQPQATSQEDGLELIDCAITATCHCAPPDNKPTPEELANCREYLQATWDLLPIRVVLCLGQLGWNAACKELAVRGLIAARPRPKFGHGVEVPIGDAGAHPIASGGHCRWLMGSYHPSQQNTFTGRLTESMLDEVFYRAKELLMNEQ